MRTYVYIDGFNLYYAIRNTPYRWLNLKLLSQKALPSNCRVDKVKYYTARVSGAVDPDQPRRQQLYLNALKTVKEIELFFGNFLAKQVWRPLANLPVADRTISSNPPVTLHEGTYTVGRSANPPVSGNEKLRSGNIRYPEVTDVTTKLPHRLRILSERTFTGWKKRVRTSTSLVTSSTMPGRTVSI